ncbi:MAG: YybH family protein [Terriglobia bacterium]
MKKLWILLVVLIVVVLVVGVLTRGRRVDVEAERAAVQEGLTQWAEAWNAKDVERVLAFTTGDASLFPPNAPIVTGKEAIRALATEFVGRPGFALAAQPTNIEIARTGDLGYSLGTYEITVNDAEGNPVTDQGKWLAVLNKQPDGTWKVVAHIWSSDLPLPAAATD